MSNEKEKDEETGEERESFWKGLTLSGMVRHVLCRAISGEFPEEMQHHKGEEKKEER